MQLENKIEYITAKMQKKVGVDEYEEEVAGIHKKIYNNLCSAV